VTLVTVSTVKGAPGGSTIALLLGRAIAAAATEEQKCILAECDLSGGDLAPLLGLPGLPGVASLALAARHGLTMEILLAHTQTTASAPRLRVLPGIAGPEQGMALSWILGELGRALADGSVAAVADLGRLRADGDNNDELRRSASANLLVTKDDIASLLHSRAAVESGHQAGTTFGVVLAGERRRPLAQVSEVTGADVVGTVRFDPRALELLLHPGRGATRLRSWTPRRARGLITDAEAIVCRLSGPGSAFRGALPVSADGGDENAPSPRSRVISRMRRRAVLVG
jgi:hypothetical protein